MKKLISRNPANNDILGEVIVSTQTEVTKAVMQAHGVKNQWRLLGVEKRIAILKSFIAVAEQYQTKLEWLITKEMGKPITQARDEFNSTIAYLRAFFEQGGEYLQDEVTFRDDQQYHRIVYEPRGVVAAIVAWNYPFSNFVWAVFPSLIVGNVVVFKHSEECPLIGKMLEEMMLSLKELPSGVFSAVYGDGEVGETLIHQPVNLIRFTGSSKVGNRMNQIAGERQIKPILEMGGSNPVVIFDDVNVDEVASKVFEGRFSNCGQICDAIKRVIVHESFHDALLEKLVYLAKKMRIGNPLLETTELGPMVASRQLDLLEAQVNDAITRGGKLAIGGHRVTPEGSYFEPTILTHITRDMRVWKEEVFGPVLPMVTFQTEAEAIALANDTIYGLGATVYSKNLERARRVANAIDAGCVDINDGNHWNPATPFLGHKASGVGCEHGRPGFQELCLMKVIAESI